MHKDVWDLGRHRAGSPGQTTHPCKARATGGKIGPKNTRDDLDVRCFIITRVGHWSYSTSKPGGTFFHRRSQFGSTQVGPLIKVISRDLWFDNRESMTGDRWWHAPWNEGRATLKGSRGLVVTDHAASAILGPGFGCDDGTNETCIPATRTVTAQNTLLLVPGTVVLRTKA